MAETGLPVLTADNLALPGVRHGFFGRRGGVSAGLYASLNGGMTSRDACADVLENRRRIAGHFGPDCDLLTLVQYHSAAVVTVETPWSFERSPRADALVTKTKNIVLGLGTADCAPVLFCDPDARVIGAAHAGWKGALAGVCEATIAAMEAIGAARVAIRAAIGPCIGQASYEVGPDFPVQFPPDAAPCFLPAKKDGHWFFNLESYVAGRLAAAGLRDIESLGVDVFAREEDFYSFRRATLRGEADYGREISAIMLEG